MSTEILQGDCLEVLQGMDSKSVDMCMTSPPYWGLRDYGTEPHIWDGAEGCMHEWGDDVIRKQSGGIGKTNVGNYKDDKLHYESKTNFCIKCNAWKGNLGLEPDYNLFINHLIQIFDEIKRVLKDTGTCWVNIGDSYGGSGGPGTWVDNKQTDRFKDKYNKYINPNRSAIAKSLIGIPERFAIAMTDAGWIRRNTIIWYKPSCMPSSADDRFTVDFEYLYFFTKKTKYWFEQQFEPFKSNQYDINKPRNKGAENYALNAHKGVSNPISEGERDWYKNGARNKRCVWKIPTQSYSDAHFATYPEELCYVPIKAGCPKGGTVLDPFMGSGTTLKVARGTGRNGIGIELNPEYIELAKKRIDIEQGRLF